MRVSPGMSVFRNRRIGRGSAQPPPSSARQTAYWMRSDRRRSGSWRRPRTEVAGPPPSRISRAVAPQILKHGQVAAESAARSSLPAGLRGSASKTDIRRHPVERHALAQNLCRSAGEAARPTQDNECGGDWPHESVGLADDRARDVGVRASTCLDLERLSGAADFQDLLRGRGGRGNRRYRGMRGRRSRASRGAGSRQSPRLIEVARSTLSPRATRWRSRRRESPAGFVHDRSCTPGRDAMEPGLSAERSGGR